MPDELPPPTVAAPVPESRRVGAVDVLRGVAVLGILAMNVTTFGLPIAAYMNPAAEGIVPYGGPFSGLNLIAWIAQHVFVDMKMMTIFSMLFGAGLVLMSGEREAAGAAGGSVPPTRRFAGVYYRRLGWLLLIGLIHAYVVWYGDILTTYALCGLVLYPLRRLAPRWLIALGVGLCLIGVVLSLGMGGMLWWMQREAAAAQAALDAGKELTAQQRGMLDGWRDANAGFNPAPEQVAREIERVRGPLSSVIGYNIENALMFQTVMFVFMSFWRCTGGMLIGMGLMKLGVFSARRSRGFYIRLAAWSYGLGFLLVGMSTVQHLRHGFGMVDFFLLGGQWNHVGSFGVALGHVAMVMLLVRSGAMRGLVERLGAAGRMALTNYLTQSLLCTAVFFGWGLGLFGSLLRWQLLLVAVAVWIVQLVWSKWWLSRFQFGPAEWAWRSLTYWRWQPMRRVSVAPAGVGERGANVTPDRLPES